MEVRPEALQTADRSGNLPTARALVAYMGRELAGIPFSQTARVLRRSPVTLSLQVQRLQRRLDTEPALAGIARRIEERLRSKRIKA
jgi:hypothetical protein